MDFSSRFALTGDIGKRGSTAFNEDDYHGIFIRVRRVHSFSRSVKFRDNECLSRHWNVTCHIFVRRRVCMCSKSVSSRREGSKNRCLAFHRIAPDNVYRVSAARRPFGNSDERNGKIYGSLLAFQKKSSATLSRIFRKHWIFSFIEKPCKFWRETFRRTRSDSSTRRSLGTI